MSTGLRRLGLGLAAMVIVAFSAPAARAQVWVGSTGTVDPNSYESSEVHRWKS